MADKLLIESYTAPVRVDREAGIIHDCLLLGKTSRNGVSYPDATRQKAIPLFESARACLSHPGERSKEALRRPRPFQDAVGKYLNVRNSPDGVRGDLKLKKRHPFTELLLDEAEENPNDFGLSPAMLGITTGNPGKETCTEIKVVRSVDVVLEPATTRGLFEEDAEGEEGPTAAEAYEQACLQAIAEVVQKALKGEIDPSAASAEVKKLLKNHLKAFGKDEEESPEEEASEAKEAGMEEEYRLLKAEKESRVLCEDNSIDPDKELLALLMDLPDRDSRVKHLNFLKRGSLIKKPKSGFIPSPTHVKITEGNFTSTLRGNS